MLTTRIDNAIDTKAMAAKCVAVVGNGGAAGLSRDLVRSGLGAICLFDKDRVGEENICRQEHALDQVGHCKVLALEFELKRINPAVRVDTSATDFCTFTDAEARDVLGGVDVLVAATDSHAAQARVNQLALLLKKPAVWAGMYRGGRAGDIAFWRPGLPSCYRCLFPSRYEAAARGRPDPPSDGATIMDVKILDAIAAQIVVGLLTAGADNRFGRLIAKLGDRQVLQVKIDPDWAFNGADPVRKYLGVPDGNDGYFSFCTVARRDPDPGGLCPDCRAIDLRQSAEPAK
jgi:molybdopterin/thiamine biosynthesis adenylyltransferase